MINQLYPAWRKLSPLIRVNLWPYGKASSRVGIFVIKKQLKNYFFLCMVPKPVVVNPNFCRYCLRYNNGTGTCCATVFYNNTGNKLNIEFVLLYICSADRYGTGGTNIPYRYYESFSSHIFIFRKMEIVTSLIANTAPRSARYQII